MTQDKLIKLVHDTYQLLFQASTPKGDYYKMLEEAELDEFGFKVIPFNDYEITPEEYTEILQKQLLTYGLTKFDKLMLENTIHLGCSPKFKTNEK